ncbi:magnesium chelatase [Streptomyces yangpuensis]|uniref:Magnesium chelatase n=1 Tax=Streptomyces yangpuensis TaxID=1648182 RepID=A0ABY5Q168_9ACTN|nr:magnesium chelatase [Streptomyces yangpuensis]
MGFARACSVALVGVDGVVVEVQADLEPGVAAFTLVGLPDKTLVESRDRVRAAVVFPVKFLCSGSDLSMSGLRWRARLAGVAV